MEVSNSVYFTFFYFVLVLCFILPPKEFVSAGLTIQNIFDSYLGSEAVDFIGYHLKRTTLTVLIHSFLPLFYYFGVGFVSPHLNLFSLSHLSSWAAFSSLICFSSAIFGILIWFLWTLSNCSYHPLTKDLAKFGTPWRDVAAQINIEFRRIEKFSSVTGGTNLYVTDSWILKSTTYKVYIVQQTDAHLSVVKSDDFVYNVSESSSGQFLQIQVSSIPPHEQTFMFTLNSLQYNYLKDRLNAPIRNARGVVIHQTLSDRFLVEFSEQVESNGVLQHNFNTDDIDDCIGCLSKKANIKLFRKCGNNLDENGCQQCYCRPMWCLECMGRWFASRQNQQNTEQWMSSRAPCPTCRTKFCMLDVLKIQ